MIVEVAVEKTKFALDTLFAYLVPRRFASSISVGSRVKVPFGPRNSLRLAFVIKILNEEDFSIDKKLKLKEIDSLVDDFSLIDSFYLGLSYWMSEHYFCTLYECLSLILPKYVKITYQSEKKCQNYHCPK